MKSFFIGFAFLMLLFQGCASSAKKHELSDQFPDQIYKQPGVNIYHDSKVGIFEFNSPEYAEGSGAIAANLLFKELLKKNIYHSIFLYDQNILLFRNTDLAAFARSQQLDLIITGKLTYFLEGGNFQASRVCKEIRAMEPIGEYLYTVWHASSCAEGEYSEKKDYIFFTTREEPSVSCFELMKKIAEQFAGMFAAAAPFQ